MPRDGVGARATHTKDRTMAFYGLSKTKTHGIEIVQFDTKQKREQWCYQRPANRLPVSSKHPEVAKAKREDRVFDAW